MSRQRLVILALCALAVLVAAALLLRPGSSEPSRAPSGLATCELSSLPREVADTMRLIHSGGPFPYPRNDGMVFGNREGHLPDREKGYYREYTVKTPGAHNRAARRIVTGGTPKSDPADYFYTADHYDSFCLVTGAGGRQ